MFTQIYSIQTVEEALACVEAGADRVGVLVGVPGGKFPCAIHEDEAKRIFDALSGKAVRVLISVADNEEDILSQTERLSPDVLHLCANFEGSAEFCEKLKKRMPEVKLMEAAKKKAEYADLLILDSVSKTVPGVGAAGITHDWGIDRAIVEAVNIPVILAGGLGPENVAEAIKAVHPDGVDSLTKTSVVKDGVILHKDIERVREFCRIAKETV